MQPQIYECVSICVNVSAGRAAPDRAAFVTVKVLRVWSQKPQVGKEEEGKRPYYDFKPPEC